MLSLDKAVTEMMVLIQESKLSGVSSSDVELAELLSLGGEQVKPLQARQIRDFAVQCCYVIEQNCRLQLTRIGIERLKKMTPALVASSGPAFDGRTHAPQAPAKVDLSCTSPLENIYAGIKP
jgi:hypothetical protein